MESNHSIENDTSSFVDLTYKLDRILRVFRMTKLYDSSCANEVKKRADAIVFEMKKRDPEKFRVNEEKIASFISDSLVEPQKKPAMPKMPSSISSINRIPESATSSPFGGSFQSKNIEKSSNNVTIDSIESFVNLNSEASEEAKSVKESKTERVVQVEEMIPKEKMYSMNCNKKEESDMSNGNSSKSKRNIDLKEYCEANANNIQNKILINEDIITLFKNQGADKVALLGVQRPHDIKTEQLYICTYMEFPKEQVISLKNKDYQNELDEFINVIRYPLALVVIGTQISEMKAHYVKFLLQMTSPLPLVIIYNQVAPDKSLVVQMNENVVSSIQNSSLLEMDSSDFNMKNTKTYKCITFKDIQITKDKNVITKTLHRKLNREIIENDQAILVEKVKTDKDEQKVKTAPKGVAPGNKFTYLLHSKFYSGSTYQEYFLYIVSENNELYTKKKIDRIEELVEFVSNSPSLCVPGLGVRANNKKLEPKFFVSCFQMRDKCPMMILRFKSLMAPNVAFVTFKPEVTEEQLKTSEIIFKEIEENRSKYLDIQLFGASKNLFKEYETNALLTEI